MRFRTGLGTFGHGHTVHFNRAPRRSVFSGVRTTAHAHVGRPAPRRRVYSTPRRQPSVRHGYHPKPSERTSYALSAPRRAAAQRFNSAVLQHAAVRSLLQNYFPNPSNIGTTNPLMQLQYGGSQQQRMIGASDHFFRSTRQPVFNRAIRAQANQLWKLVHAAYGGKQPRLHIADLGPGAAAITTKSGRRGRITVNLAQADLAGSAYPRGRADLAKVLLHEWTHARQPPSLPPYGTPVGTVRIEGGAEAYAQDVAKRHGIKGYNSYPSYVQWVRRYLGPNWVHHGQFMGP
jgi:hypothetical protein